MRVFICHYIAARLRVAESTKELLAAKKENLANGLYGPPVSITEGDRLHSYYLRKKIIKNKKKNPNLH